MDCSFGWKERGNGRWDAHEPLGSLVSKKVPLKSGVHTRLPEDGVDQTSVLVVS